MKREDVMDEKKKGPKCTNPNKMVTQSFGIGPAKQNLSVYVYFFFILYI